MRRRDFVQRLAAAGLVTGIDPLLVLRDDQGPQDDPSALAAYSAQLHLHGLSNHNGCSQPGSIQWHSHWAKVSGIDVLWWTDHDGFQTGIGDYRLKLDSARIDPASLHVVGLGRNDPDGRKEPSVLAAEVTGGKPAAEMKAGYLRWSLANPGAGFETFSYRPRVSVKPPIPPKGGGIIKSLPCQPRIEFDLERGTLSADARVELLVLLSWHYQGRPVQHYLRYRFVGPNRPGSRELIRDYGVLVCVPTVQGRQRVALELREDAALLPDGADNVLQDWAFVLSSRKGAEAWARIGEVHFLRRGGDEARADVYRFVRDQTKAQERRTGVRQFANYEIASRRTTELYTNHYAFYVPDQTPVLPPFKHETAPFRTMSSWAHQQGGLMAYCHPFGTVRKTSLPPETAAEQLAANILANEGFGADLLEVGYLNRAGCELRHYMQLWDILTANGLLLCGTGVSDAHGSVWGPDMHCNPFVTWIWARSTSPRHLLDGLRRRQAYFGNPFLFQGDLDLSLGRVRMGETGVVDGDATRLRVRLSPVSGARVLLYQGYMRPGKRVQYLRHGQPIDPSAPITLDTTRSSFVRVEVVRGDGEFLVGSNPIVALKGPAIQIVEPVYETAEGTRPVVRWRIAGDVTNTAVRWCVGAEDAAAYQFTPGTASGPGYEAQLPAEALRSGQLISYRIRARGPDWVRLWPPARQAPLRITVTESASCAASPAPTAVISSLTPTPTAAGTEVRFSLTAAAALTVEVRNLAGVPVRALCRDRLLGAGSNVVLWDGRGDGGLPVPNGVYLVEASAKSAAGEESRAIGRVVLTR